MLHCGDSGFCWCFYFSRHLDYKLQTAPPIAGVSSNLSPVLLSFRWGFWISFCAWMVQGSARDLGRVCTQNLGLSSGFCLSCFPLYLAALGSILWFLRTGSLGFFNWKFSWITLRPELPEMENYPMPVLSYSFQLLSKNVPAFFTSDSCFLYFIQSVYSYLWECCNGSRIPQLSFILLVFGEEKDSTVFTLICWYPEASLFSLLDLHVSWESAVGGLCILCRESFICASPQIDVCRCAATVSSSPNNMESRKEIAEEGGAGGSRG